MGLLQHLQPQVKLQGLVYNTAAKCACILRTTASIPLLLPAQVCVHSKFMKLINRI
jgi:hypothetical protein